MAAVYHRGRRSADPSRGTPSPRRVLLVCDWFVRYTVGLAAGLADAGAEVTLLTRSHDGEFGGTPDAMREYVAASLGPEVRHLCLEGRVRDPRGWRETARLHRAVRRLAPHTVHVQDSVLNDPRLLAAALAPPRRYALTVHDLERHPGDPPMRLDQRAAWHAVLRGAGLVFVHAGTLRDRLVSEQRPRAEVVVVPHGADAPAVAPLPERPSLLLFGRMSLYKGLETLLEAMPLVWEQAPQTRLTVAGRGEIGRHPTLADERVLVRNEYVADADVPGLFDGATCVVLPYREASQSGVAAIAKRHGRAIVATDVGGLSAAAADGGARLVRPEDPRALAEALLEVVRTPGLAERMGRAAADAVRTELSWTCVGEATLAAYERHLDPVPR
jgi:glycosyltransferase involved in cell wall biosynthesis